MSALFFLGIPTLCVLAILVGKTKRIWYPWLKRLNRLQQLSVLVAMCCLSAYSFNKPGPTIANLKLLVAQRDGKLSNGNEFADKQEFLSAQSTIEEIEDAVIAANENLSLTTTNNAKTLATAISAQGGYFRLDRGVHIYEGYRLSGSIVDYSVSNGVATVAVWFSVVPSEAPALVLNYSLGTATNCVGSFYSTECSFPETVAYGDFECYEYTFNVPSDFLDDGKLIAPLNFTRELAFGNPETKDNFNLKGELAIHRNGKFYKAFTGTKTIDDKAVHFYNGRVYNPMQKMKMEIIE